MKAKPPITLYGVLPGAGGLGVALIAVGGAEPEAFRVGQELTPGLRLVSVLSDRVVVEECPQALHP